MNLKFKKAWRLPLVICMLLAARLWCTAYAEDFAAYDFSNSLSGYAEAVAKINATAGSEIWAADASLIHLDEEACAVLCKTDGSPLTAVEAGLLCQLSGPDNCYTLYYESSDAAESAIAEYLAQSHILYAELDGEITAASNETAISFNSWGAERMNFASYVSLTQEWGGGSALVAVIDSGVANNSFFAGRIPERGYDYVDADADPTNDSHGHGTHVAGIIIDCTPNLPVCLYPIRTLNEKGTGKISNAVNAIREAIQKNVDVINLSVESRSMSSALDSAIADAIQHNIVVVIAAGNSNTDTKNICPAHLTTVGAIVVGSAEYQSGDCVRASYSNYGSSVDLYTFGSNILSCSNQGGFTYSSGTSMAAPHISALCAMLRLTHPGISPAGMEQRIVSAAALGGGMFVPDLISMVPAAEGFSTDALTLHPSETLQLPLKALPSTSLESVSYAVENTSVASVQDGLITALRPGETWVTASCLGIAPVSIRLSVTEGAGDRVASLPISTKRLGDMAYIGNNRLEWVLLPDGLTTLGSHVFDSCGALRFIRLPESLSAIGENDFSGAVVLCPPGSAAYDFCVQNGLKYILEQ